MRRLIHLRQNFSPLHKSTIYFRQIVTNHNLSVNIQIGYKNTRKEIFPADLVEKIFNPAIEHVL